MVGTVPTVKAAEIEIICNQGNEECDVYPNDNAPVFDDENFPEYDLKPGDEFTRNIRVTNNRDKVCRLRIDNFEVTEDTEVLESRFFSDELLTEFSGDESTTGEISFSNLFLLSPLFIGNVDAGETLDFNWRVKFNESAGNEYQRAVLDFDFEWTFSCGDEEVSELLIEKYNNTGGVTLAGGAVVVYSLVISTTDFPVDSVHVIDLPPDGFEYRSGSWIANSNLRGDLKSLGITTEPTYSSPGEWLLGDMEAGERVVLTYIADISDYLDPGTYPDLAWAYGFFEGVKVLANDATNPLYFVDTEVIIDKDGQSGSTIGSVLGISDENLPATGSDFKWIIFSISILILGSLMITKGRRMNKNEK